MGRAQSVQGGCRVKKRKNWFGTLLSYADGRESRMLFSVILSIVSIVSGLVPFYCIYQMVDAYLTGLLENSTIIYWGTIGVLSYAVKVVCFGFSTGLSHHVAYYVLEGLRLKIADAFLKAPLGEVQAHSIGEIKNVIVDRIEEIEPPLAHMIPEGSGHLVLPVVSLIALFFLDFRVALASLLSLPIGFVFMLITFAISGKSMTKYMESNARLNSVIVEYIEGIEVIRAFGKAGSSYKKYADAVLEYKEFVIDWMRSTWVTMKLTFAFMPATLLGVVPVSLFLVSRGSLSVSEMILAVMLAMSMIVSFAKLEVFANSIQQMKYTVDQTETFLNMTKLTEPGSKAILDGGDVRLKNVRFSYSAKSGEILHGIDLTLPQGSYTALVGPSGGGKSTLARLIARFWDVCDGSIEIGGVDIRNIPIGQLSDLVSFVTQDNFLFQTSIKENIRIGNPSATDEEVIAAAKKARCDEFISKLPDGYDTSAGEAGKKLSGGEKQRIAIARIMLKNAPIVILDEATAFTDPENEHLIQQSISELTRGKTLLVIAHRLSTVKDADQIVVINGGTVEAMGSHEELLKHASLYQRMWSAHIGAKSWAVHGKENKIHV